MTKEQLIEDICRLNRSARPQFLAQFEENELWQYLHKLLRIREELGSDELLQPVAEEEPATKPA